MSDPAIARGSCLCGAVRYEVHGPLRDVLICHCEQCRRWHGAAAGFTAVARGDLELPAGNSLRWYADARSEAGARRGFCADCGASLFWDAPGRDTISIAEGTLDPPTKLRVAGHIYVSEAADSDRLPDDGLPRYARGG